jgi:fatty-acid peroxygenase
VFGEAVQVHAAAVCEWARTGTPYDRLGADLATIVDGFGGLGPRHVAARRARHRAERWARTQVRSARERQTAGAGTALDAVATYRGRNGELLPERVAAVELLNVLRPTVAVAYFVAFAADALARRPELRERLGSGSAGDLEGFAHEVRRYYPFVPMLAARVRRSVRYAGRVLPPGRRVVLDVYGTLHDPQIWPDPERFDIDRFTGAEPDQDTFVPQGGGDGRTGHRCPGERVAVELIKAAARHLVDERAPGQEHGSIPLNRMPTRPLRRAAPRARRLGRR